MTRDALRKLRRRFGAFLRGPLNSACRPRAAPFHSDSGLPCARARLAQTKPASAPSAARNESRKPFLESPADFVTRAPNVGKLGQPDRARQDLVRNSESSTKCGDCGDESSGGRISIGYLGWIRKAPIGAAAIFSWQAGHTRPRRARKRLALSPIVATRRAVHFCGFTLLSRNDGPFLLILSETPRKIAAFRRTSPAPIL